MPTRKVLIKLLLILIIGITFLGLSLKNDSVLAKYQIREDNLPPNPFDRIAHFYEALAQEDWNTIEGLSTPALRAYTRLPQFREKWRNIIAKNDGLEFEMFLVSNQYIDEEKGEAFVLGKVHWNSKTGNIKNYNQAVLLTRTSDGWKIKELKNFSSVTIVEDFYQAISNEDWSQLQRLTTGRYWSQLEKAGVISALRTERKKFNKEVYVFFLIDRLWEAKKTAFVSGEVTWKPLSTEFAENKVTIRLLKQGGQWKIDNVKGHWDLKK